MHCVLAIKQKYLHSDPHLWRPIWYKKPNRSDLYSRAMKMIDVLVKHKIGVQRPVIWVNNIETNYIL